MPQLLDPLQLPLDGVRLIEASAGTGKTHNIVTLVLRLLLEKGLQIGQILVVTYTNAATEELRARIRQRLHAALRQMAGGQVNDPVLVATWNALDDSRKENRARLIRKAVCRMDEAAVFTIHGFCQRVLQEFPFECGLAFRWDVMPDDAALYREAAADFWRQCMGQAYPMEARWLLETMKGPDRLLQHLAAMRSVVTPKVLPETTAANRRCFAEAEALFQKICATWHELRKDIQSLLAEHEAIDRRRYKKEALEQLFEAMDALCAWKTPPPSQLSSFKMLTASMLAQKTKEGKKPPAHPFFDLCNDFWRLLANLVEGYRIWLLKTAQNFVSQAISHRKDAERVLAFDDLLVRLHQALSSEPWGSALCKRIRQKFPVALIDEFQDTDPLQYGIFQKIYGIPNGPALLCLIGDPKQAIYSFRGADIFSYVRAKRHAGPSNTYTMDTNWRSSSGLVAAANHLFSRHPYPFIFHQDIPFYAVHSGPNADANQLRLPDSPQAALTIRFLPSNDHEKNKQNLILSDAARRGAASDCAAQIARLLNLAEQNQATIGKERLKARDIAVLVRSHREGRMIQDALRQRGVASVSLQRDSVFDTQEAEDLTAILEAVAAPADERRLRTALATETLGWNASQLIALERDDTFMERVQSRFHRYRDLWHRHGFLTAFMILLKEEDVPNHVRSLPAGERRLTNLLHLAELLHQASQTRPGTDKLLRWFKDRQRAQDAPEEEQLRLESDENVVHVVTIHKSKGLEYPVVFIPFPWTLKPRSVKKDDPTRFHDPKDLSLCVDLGSKDIEQNRQLALKEEMAENMRLLYVALTRAKSMCVTWWGRINEASASAMAYLLFPSPSSDPLEATPESTMDDFSTDEDLLRSLEDIARSSSGAITVEKAQVNGEARRHSFEESPPQLQARTFHRDWGPRWRVTSYTHLAMGAEPHTPDYDAVAVEEPEQGTPSEEIEPMFLFPRGPRAGQCLHEILERIHVFSASAQDLQAEVAEALARHGLEPHWQDSVLSMVQNVLATPLKCDRATVTLEGLGQENCFPEWEFHFPVGPLDPPRLYTALEDKAFYEKSVKGLQFETLQGLVRGFIDLVFRSDGRYFIADYKSNHLGNRLEDYAPNRLESAMHVHRYPLQMLLYTVALHRYLSVRLPKYDYDTHFGGVFYLFLRGMRRENQGNTGVFYHRPKRIVIERLDALFRQSCHKDDAHGKRIGSPGAPRGSQSL
ncbi:MAG: exodeoxyribonuclease V subunit beta [Desulfosoma sp.]|uniref:exodeoxyribonuclease V subunit beta n=1 Tax=Desulfosoma sp. TaxID=2603217 RepID=UPI004049A7AD